MRKTLVVVGHCMVGHRLLEIAVERGLNAEWDVVVHAEEDVPAYDRVGLSSWFSATSSEELCLVAEGFLDRPGIDPRLADPVTAIDTVARTTTSASGRITTYDALVLATG